MERVYRVDVGREEFYREFVFHFSRLGWSVRREDGVCVAEGPRNVNWVATALLLAIGLFLLMIGIPPIAYGRVTFFLIIGALLCLFTIIYIISAERHIVVVKEEADKYRVATNSEKALKIIVHLFSRISTEEVREVREITTEEAYDNLLKLYIRTWGTGAKQKLEKKIEKIMKEKGLSREEAIKSIYEKEMGL